MKALSKAYPPFFVLFQTRIGHFTRILKLISGLYFSLVTATFAQFQKPDNNIPSPNAASLGLYGEVPISLYTGTPNVEIPLYTLEEGKLKVPITLSYHASGVRVNQHSSWVGLNWNLNAGGVITRVIKDAADEIIETPRPFSSSSITYTTGYYHNTNLLGGANWNSPSYLTSFDNVLIKDTEPDEFNFNIMGLSGSFYLNDQKNWQVKCDQHVKVELDEGLIDIPADMQKSYLPKFVNDVGSYFPAKTFKGFIITTIDGNKYYFGGIGANQEPYIEYSIPFFSQKNLNWSADSWYLREIITPQGESIKFKYEREASNGKYVAAFYPSISVDISSVTNNNIFWGRDLSCQFTTTTLNSGSGQYGGALIRPIYLSRIESSKATIVFNRMASSELSYSADLLKDYVRWFANQTNDPDRENGPFPYLMDTDIFERSTLGPLNETGRNTYIISILESLKWKKLSTIEVKDNLTGSIQSKIALKYNNDNTPVSERLYLQEVAFVSKQSESCQNKYSLSYYKDPSNNLPNYCDLNNKIDHWGFFNNKSFNLNSLYTGTIGDYNTSRSATNNIDILREGSLKKIIYPTNGYTEIEYQPHSIYAFQDANTTGNAYLQINNLPLVGGLRIYKLTNSDGFTTTTKEYEYIFNNGSSGILASLPLYDVANIQARGENNQVIIKRVFSTNNVVPGSINEKGSHIGYRQVKEKLSDGSYKILKFTNFQSDDGNHFDEVVPQANRIHQSFNSYDPLIDKSLERGKVIFEGNYRSTGEKVTEKTITYQPDSPLFVKAANPFAYSDDCSSAYFVGTAYKIYTYNYLPVSETNVAYDPQNAGKFTTDLTTYQYNSIGLPYEVKTNRNGKINKKLAKYSVDYSAANAGDEEVNALRLMNDLGMLGIPVEQQIWSNESGTDGMVNGYYNSFKKYDNGTNNVQIKKTSQFATNSPLAGVGFSGIINGSFIQPHQNYTKLIANFDFSDAYTNLGEPLHYKDGDGIETYLEWYSGSKSGLLKKKTVSGVPIEYDYEPLVGISWMKDANGYYTYYSYDGFNRLITVKDNWHNLVESHSYKLGNSSGCITPQLVAEPFITPTYPSSTNNYKRILILGNSITKIPARLDGSGWDSPALRAENGGWGMAASTKEKDYAHILADRFKGLDPSAQVVSAYLPRFEHFPGWPTFNFDTIQTIVNQYFGGQKPDLVIIRLIENVDDGNLNDPAKSFKSGYNELINKAYAVSQPNAKVILTTSFWEHQPLSEGVIRQVAAERSLPLVELSDMRYNPLYRAANDPASIAAFPNADFGVNEHPGDVAMLEIADRIWGKLTGQSHSSVPMPTNCATQTAALLTPANSSSVAGSWAARSDGSLGLTIPFSLNVCIPSGQIIKQVEVWASTTSDGFQRKVGNAIAMVTNPNNFTLLSLAGSSNSQWLPVDGSTQAGPLNPGTYKFWVKVTKYDGTSFESSKSTITLVAPATSAGCGLTKIRVFPRTDCCSGRTVDAQIQVSAVGKDGPWTTAFTIPSGETTTWREFDITGATGTYKAIRYLSPTAANTNVAELEFYSGSTKLAGTPFGDAGGPHQGNAAVSFDKVFDGNTTTFYDALNPTGGYVGLELTNCSTSGSWGATMITPVTNTSVVGVLTTRPDNSQGLIIPLSVSLTIPGGQNVGQVQIRAKTPDGSVDRLVGNAMLSSGTTYILNTGQGAAGSSGQWLPPSSTEAGPLDAGIFQFYALIKRSDNTTAVTTSPVTVTLTAPASSGTGTVSFLSPTTNSSVEGTIASGFTGFTLPFTLNVTPSGGATIGVVEVWASTSTGSVTRKVGHAVLSSGTTYTLSASLGVAGNTGQWLPPSSTEAGPLNADTYKFWAVVKRPDNTTLVSNSTTPVSVTLTAPASGAGCSLTKIRVFPRTDCCSGRTVGAQIQVSAVGKDGPWTTAFTIPSGETTTWREFDITGATGTYKAIRYLSPTAANTNVAELEFYSGSTKLAGTPFGDAGGPHQGNAAVSFDKVFDGNTTTFYDALNPTGGYVGLELTNCSSSGSWGATMITPVTNTSVVGVLTTRPDNSQGLTIPLSVSLTIPGGQNVGQVQIRAKTPDGSVDRLVGNAMLSSGTTYVLGTGQGAAGSSGQWLPPSTTESGPLDAGIFQFYALIKRSDNTTAVTTSPVTVTLTAPLSSGSGTVSFVSPTNNSSVIGTVASGFTGFTLPFTLNVTPSGGATIGVVEVWASTYDGSVMRKVGHAVLSSGTTYTLSASLGVAGNTGQWLPPSSTEAGPLNADSNPYKFWAVVKRPDNTTLVSNSTTPISVTLTAPATSAGCSLTKIRVFPRADCCSGRTVGAQIQVSAIGKDGPWTTAFTIPSGETTTWREFDITGATGTYKAIRYLSPTAANTNVAELEFYSGSTKLAGTPFGDAGGPHQGNAAVSFDKVFDGNTTTFYDALNPTGGYVGLELTNCSSSGSWGATMINPVTNISVVGVLTTRPDNSQGMTIPLSVSLTIPGGQNVGQVQIRAKTPDGSVDRLVGNAVLSSGTTYILNTGQGAAGSSGQWLPASSTEAGPLDAGIFQFYALIKRSDNTTAVTTSPVTITLTAPLSSGSGTVSFVSPTNNSSVIGTVASGFTGFTLPFTLNVTPSGGATVGTVEIWASTYDGSVMRKVGHAVLSSGTTYTLSASLGVAVNTGQWLPPSSTEAGPLNADTYKFWAVVKRPDNTTLVSNSTTPVSVTLTAPATSAGCSLTKIWVFPRADCCANRVVGAVIQVSTVGKDGPWVNVYTIPGPVTAASWLEFAIPGATGNYKAIRYVGTSSSWNNVAELEFYSGTTKLTGTPFGSTQGNQAINFTKAFDGNTSTYFEAATIANGYLGLELTGCSGL